MTDIDIVAELRERYEAAPQGKWAAGQIDGNDYILQPEDEYFDRIVCLVDDDRFSNLIIAMHEALPALLDAVDALRGLRRYPANTVSAEVYEMRLDAALAALKRSDEG